MPPLYVQRAKYVSVLPAAGETDDVVIDPQFGKCVGFLCGRGATPRQEPLATVFFVSADAVPGLPVIYAITARHAIEANRFRSLHIRVRLKGGGFRDLDAPYERWRLHRAEKADVAAIKVDLPDDEFDTAWLGLETFHILTEPLREVMAAELWTKIGVGDAVFYPGLFAKVPGESDILPVVRFGNISRLPQEPLRIKYRVPRPNNPGKFSEITRNIQGYLVEVRSWHGFSGSPVFLYFPIEEYVRRERYRLDHQGPLTCEKDLNEKVERGLVRATGLRDAWLLGMVSAYYDYDLRDRGRATNTNAGLAIVIPPDPIKELIEKTEDFVKDRQKIAKRDRDKKPAATAASRDPSDPAFTKEVFTDALKRSSRRLAPPGRGTKGT